jgi:hypothetical protein
MARAKRTPVVPLEAGIGPENPPCPACGEPLFGWIDARPGLAGPVRRCESCGLAVAGASGDAGVALAALDRHRDGNAVTFPNRDGFAAWIGGAGWSGLEPGARCFFTPEAARRLLARRDQVVGAVRWAPGPGIATMWQTVLNGFTFGRNVALGALGRAAMVPATPLWQRRLDGFISVAIALPTLIVAVPMELTAAIFKRGSAVSIDLNQL